MSVESEFVICMQIQKKLPYHICAAACQRLLD